MPAWDPTLTLDETVAAFTREARARYGDQRAQELEDALRAVAQEVWRLAQYELDPLDEMPDVILNPENL